MKKQFITAAALPTVGLITGCGSSGSMMSGQSGAGKSVIAGAVADGYLVNATVFLDRDMDYQPDQNEATTTTKEGLQRKYREIRVAEIDTRGISF